MNREWVGSNAGRRSYNAIIVEMGKMAAAADDGEFET